MVFGPTLTSIIRKIKNLWATKSYSLESLAFSLFNKYFIYVLTQFITKLFDPQSVYTPWKIVFNFFFFFINDLKYFKNLCNLFLNKLYNAFIYTQIKLYNNNQTTIIFIYIYICAYTLNKIIQMKVLSCQRQPKKASTASSQ